MASSFLALGKLFVKGCDSFHAGGFGVGGSPLAEEDRAFLLYLRVGNGVCGCHTEALEKGFVGEGSLETRSGILDEAVENGQGT